MAKAALNRLSLDDLKAELRRRERELGKLQTQREKLAARLADLDRRIANLGGDVAGAPGGGGARSTKVGRRRRPRNREPLAEVLMRVFPANGEPMKVSDAVEAVRKAGYQTTSDNFATIVNQTLIKDERFEQVRRGYYKLA